jgi:succinate-semialdehyde dehydrogenase/glutarate-semialdehyde dehydrogenase
MADVASASMTKMYVNGEWVEAQSGETQEILSPHDGSVVEVVPRASREDTRAAIRAAEDAMPEWADTSPDERARLLLAGVEKVKEHQKDLAKTLSAEQGKPVFEAMGEIHHFLHGMTFYAGLASKVRGSQVPLPPDMGKHSYGLVIKKPVGVCGAIVPWNFPITLMGTKIGPALIAGNTIIVKPSPTTPLTTLKVVGLLNEAGLPAGVLNCEPVVRWARSSWRIRSFVASPSPALRRRVVASWRSPARSSSGSPWSSAVRTR